MKRYGLPYKGSKNKIAQKIIQNIPASTYFYDLFGGGGAITHCALLSGKFKYVHYNDLSEIVYDYVYDCIFDDMSVDKKSSWISRDDFNRLKNDNPYIRYIWSFGNNGLDYMYGYNVEDFKRKLHNYVYYGDMELFSDDNARLSEQDIEYAKTIQTIEKRYAYIRNKIHTNDTRCIEYERQISYDEFRNCILTEKNSFFTLSNKSYDEVNIRPDSVIYCDIPYVNTRNTQYHSSFDYKRFYDWCRTNDNIIIISEYVMPEDFICISEIDKFCSVNHSDKRKMTTEKLFVHEKWKDKFSNKYLF